MNSPTFVTQYTRLLRRAARGIGPLKLAYAKADAIVRYWPQVRARPVDAIRFVFADRECDNYTYDISNRAELAAFLADALGAERRELEALIDELETDRELREALNARLRPRADRRHVALYARRAGWYALVRLKRPRLVVEVGVHDGLGSSVMLRALERNGGDGRLVGIDFDPTAGWLVPSWLRSRYVLLIENSATALPRLAAQGQIDLLVVDGDHSYSGETADYTAALSGLTPDGILLSDTARYNRALQDFTSAHARRYGFWAEQPVRHFFAGDGIGLSLPS